MCFVGFADGKCSFEFENVQPRSLRNSVLRHKSKISICLRQLPLCWHENSNKFPKNSLGHKLSTRTAASPYYCDYVNRLSAAYWYGSVKVIKLPVGNYLNLRGNSPNKECVRWPMRSIFGAKSWLKAWAKGTEEKETGFNSTPSW
jgi:hypothetical protein